LKGEWAEARGESIDIAGSVVFGISLVVVMYGFTMLQATPGFILILLGILGLLAFGRLEARTDSPILDIGLLRRNTVFVFSNLSTMINFCTASATIFFMSLYLQYSREFSPQTAGLIMLTHPVIMTVFSPIAGRLSDRVDPRIVASVGMMFSCVSLVLFVFLNEATALGYIIASLAIFGFGTTLFASPNANAVMGSVEKKSLGVASGMQGTMRSCGQMLGMGIVLILFSIYIGEAEITPEYYPAFLASAKVGFTICAALCFSGIFTQLAGGRARQE
jgi:MFS family permease